MSSVYLYANRYYSFVTAIILPNREAFSAAGFGSDVNISKDPNAIRQLLEDIKRVCKEMKLRTFEIPRAILIELDPWTPENGMLTPALKIKRPACAEKYNKVLDFLSSKIKDATQIDQIVRESAKIAEQGLSPDKYDDQSISTGTSSFGLLQ